MDFLGIDYILAKKPIVLELQRGPGGLHSDINSKFSLLIEVFADKRYQHELIGEFMPDFESNPENFHKFIEKHEKVVYKHGLSSMGRNVSIFEKPNWEYNLLEEFIEPRKTKINGKNHPYIVRDVFEYNNCLPPKITDRKLFSKVAKNPTETDPNLLYRLNLYQKNTFEGNVDWNELKVIKKKTKEVLNKICSFGKNVGWNPKKATNHLLLGVYTGFSSRSTDSESYKNWYKEVMSNFDVEYRKVNLATSAENLEWISNSLDAVLMPSNFRYRFFDGYENYSVPFTIKKEENIVFYSRCNKPVVVENSRNFFVMDDSPEETSKKILEIFAERV